MSRQLDREAGPTSEGEKNQSVDLGRLSEPSDGSKYVELDWLRSGGEIGSRLLTQPRALPFPCCHSWSVNSWPAPRFPKSSSAKLGVADRDFKNSNERSDSYRWSVPSALDVRTRNKSYHD